MRIYNVPKLVNKKYFQLANLPYVACWASRLFAFTWKEFTLCRKIDNNRFCKIPTQVNDLLDSCLFGLVEGIPWSSLVDKCVLEHVDEPKEFIELTTRYIIYMVWTERLGTILCPDYSKPVSLLGSGTINIPTDCRFQLGSRTTFTHKRSSGSNTLELKLDTSIWDMNLDPNIP